MVNKVDSNFTGLRYALEVQGSPKVLPGTDGADAVWKELEPNSYSDFGGTTTLKARTPITAGRQRKKGRAVDLDAKGGFNLDFTSDNMLDFMPGYFFAAWRKQAVTDFGTPTTITAPVTGGSPADATFDKVGAFVGHAVVGSIVNATGFTDAVNNGLKIVSTVAANSLSVTDPAIVVDASPDGNIKVVGVQSTVGDLDVDASDAAHPAITSTTINFSNLHLIPGQWIYIGGDDPSNAFTNDGNNGFARVFTVAAHRLVLDKTQNTMVTEANTTKLVQLFFGDFIKNESDPTLIVAQTYQLERSLSTAGFEYLSGSFPNELTVDMKSADKIELTMTFVALDAEEVDYGDRKIGTFPDIATDANFYNTSQDLIRIRASEQGSAAPLFAFMQTMTMKISNNVSPLKALGVFGAFDVTIGDFVVDGDITAYFSDMAAVQAVRAADSLTVDFVLSLDNRAWVFDIPHLTFDKGNLSVTKDQPVTIPVGINAAEDQITKTTLRATYFPYLPDAAAA